MGGGWGGGGWGGRGSGNPTMMSKKKNVTTELRTPAPGTSVLLRKQARYPLHHGLIIIVSGEVDTRNPFVPSNSHQLHFSVQKDKISLLDPTITVAHCSVLILLRTASLA